MADDGYTAIFVTTDAQGGLVAEMLRSGGIDARFHGAHASFAPQIVAGVVLTTIAGLLGLGLSTAIGVYPRTGP